MRMLVLVCKSSLFFDANGSGSPKSGNRNLELILNGPGPCRILG